LIAKDPKSAELIKPVVLGREVKRYQLLDGKQYLIWIPKGWTRLTSGGQPNGWKWLQRHYPAMATHLKPFAKEAQQRCDQGEYWWELRACDYYQEFEKPKIVYPNISHQPEFTLDENGWYTNQKCFIIGAPDKYLLGILNSSLTYWWFRLRLPKLRGDFYEPSYVYFKEFPVRAIDLNQPTDQATHDRLVHLVTQMLDLKKRLATTALDPHSQTVLKRQMEAIDEEIDKVVYGVYNLTAEEIEIVEKQ